MDTQAMTLLAKVAVPGPFLTPLDYYVPATPRGQEGANVVVGGRVQVPFRQRKVIGLVMALSSQADCDLAKIKPIIKSLEDVPLFNAAHLALFWWCSAYYQQPIGEVVMAALPKRLKAGEPADMLGLERWQITSLGASKTVADLPKRAYKLQQLLQVLADGEPKSADELNRLLGSWRVQAKKFMANGWLQTKTGSCLPVKAYANKPQHRLNPEQQTAVNTIMASQDWGDEVAAKPSKFAAFLLQGITGSGKTEVYLALMEQVLQRQQQVLVLVPEIGLTPHMVSRFEAYLQQPVALMHSGMTDRERHCSWHLVRTNQVKVLLGTRSAVFVPFAHLGLCIIDEEHDLSYKQQEGFRYSARDLLVRRAWQDHIPVVLGSATPSLESLHNVEQGRYQAVALTQRAAGAHLPSLRLLDIRGEKVHEGVATPLKTAMHKHLEQGGQVLLFLNRRGFAPVLMCHECGWQASCPSCDANMTYHQTHAGQDLGYLHCHHCDEQLAQPNVCPSCGATEFVKLGQGTERLEATVQDWFADKKVIRIDRDTTRKKGAMAYLSGQAASGHADILIGTQMLAKGHHFPEVTLVGLVDIDQGLFSTDYRAFERMAQLITQVAGRAGRALKPGEVLIQTHHPDHPLLTTLVTSGYHDFAKKALQDRQQAHLPPYSFQALVRAEAHQATDAINFLTSLKEGLTNFQVSLFAEAKPVELWGPVAAPMLRRQGRYRFQLMLQASERAPLKRLLASMLPHIYQSPLARKVRWNLDIDPQEMY